MIDISSFGAIGDTSLTSDAEIVMLEFGLPSTFVPGRNLVFFVYAAALGYRRGLTTLVGGMCETDYSGYPDCRDATLRALQEAIRLGTEVPFSIETPLMWRSKAETWALAQELGGDGLRRSHPRGDAHLLQGRARHAPRLGLWLRGMPGLRAPRQRLCRVASVGRGGWQAAAGLAGRGRPHDDLVDVDAVRLPDRIGDRLGDRFSWDRGLPVLLDHRLGARVRDGFGELRFRNTRER